MLTKKKKSKVIKDSQTHGKDTGSPEVQISILSKEIEELTKHLKRHAKDNHSRRRLLGKVAERQKLMKYLAKKSPRRHKALVGKVK